MDNFDRVCLMIVILGVAILTFIFIDRNNMAEICNSKGGLYIEGRCLRVEVLR